MDIDTRFTFLVIKGRNGEEEYILLYANERESYEAENVSSLGGTCVESCRRLNYSFLKEKPKSAEGRERQGYGTGVVASHHTQLPSLITFRPDFHRSRPSPTNPITLPIYPMPCMYIFYLHFRFVGEKFTRQSNRLSPVVPIPFLDIKMLLLNSPTVNCSQALLTIDFLRVAMQFSSTLLRLVSVLAECARNSFLDCTRQTLCFVAYFCLAYSHLCIYPRLFFTVQPHLPFCAREVNRKAYLIQIKLLDIPACYTFSSELRHRDIQWTIYISETVEWFHHHKFWNKESMPTTSSIHHHQKSMLLRLSSSLPKKGREGRKESKKKKKKKVNQASQYKWLYNVVTLLDKLRVCETLLGISKLLSKDFLVFFFPNHFLHPTPSSFPFYSFSI